MEHWDKELIKICQINNNLHAADRIEDVDPENRSHVRRHRSKELNVAGIAVSSSVYLHALSKNTTTAEEGLYYLPIHANVTDEFRKHIGVVQAMREELLTESKVIRQFLSFALGFDVSFDYFAHSLDSDILTDYFNESRIKSKPMDTTDPAVINRLDQFDKYIEENRAIVETMANRQLENILLGDIL